MEAHERINVIRGLREVLLELEFPDLELYFLENSIAPLTDDEYRFDRNLALTRRLQESRNSALLQLSRSLGSQSSNDLTPVDEFRRLEVFISHPASAAGQAHVVRERLSSFAIDGFVAHDDIAPNADWQTEIEAKLQSCGAGIALLAGGFHTSDWCEQEVGWLRGRRVPVVSIKLGEDPRGPLARRQAIAFSPDLDESTAAVLDILEEENDLQSSLTESYVTAMNESRSFRQTDQIWPRMKRREGLSLEQCARLWWAAKMNSQVSQASCRPEGDREGYPTVVERHIREQQAFAQAGISLNQLFRLANDLAAGD